MSPGFRSNRRRASRSATVVINPLAPEQAAPAVQAPAAHCPRECLARAPTPPPQGPLDSRRFPSPRGAEGAIRPMAREEETDRAARIHPRTTDSLGPQDPPGTGAPSISDRISLYNNKDAPGEGHPGNGPRVSLGARSYRFSELLDAFRSIEVQREERDAGQILKKFKGMEEDDVQMTATAVPFKQPGVVIQPGAFSYPGVETPSIGRVRDNRFVQYDQSIRGRRPSRSSSRRPSQDGSAGDG